MNTALLFTEDYTTLFFMLGKEKLSEKVGNKIRSAREKAGISQEELSARAGFYRTYVGHVEVGRYTPSVYTIYKIAKALKVDSSELLPF